MLTLKYARACHAQQEELFREIGEQVRMRQEGQILLVPDQISHEMERQLCLSCGDSVSLYAEVLTISQLANRVLSETGGSAAPILDDGGRVLVMNLAFHSVASELQYYRGKEEIPDFLKDLLRTYDELESGMVRAEEFLKLSEQIEMQEKRKFHDLGLIFQAYDAFTSQLQNDPKMIYT